MANEFPIDIVVRATGAESAVNTFDKRLDALSASSAEINRQLKLVVDNTSKLGANAGGATKLASDLDRVESEAKGAAVQLEKVQSAEATIGSGSGGADLANDLEKVEKPASRAADSLDRLASRAGAFVVAAGTAAIAATVVGIVRQGDAYALLEDRIRRATAATGDFVQVRDEIFDIAFQSGQSIETVNKVFESINRSRNELNASTDDILDVTRAVQQLGVISGASRTETQNALRQLSQGFSSDFLRAEEFNSILENTPEIAFRIASGLEVSLGTLQQMVRSGELLSADVFQSILSQSEEINETLEDAPLRLERAYAQLGQSVDGFLAGVDSSLGEDGLSGSIASRIGQAATLLQGFTQASAQLDRIQSNLNNQLVEAQSDLAELTAVTPLFYRERHEAQIRATEAQIVALKEQISTQQELDRVETERAARKEQELESAKRVAAVNENIDSQTKALVGVRNELATATERLFEEEKKRNDAINSNPLGATIAEREVLLQRSREKLADGLEAIRDREIQVEQQAANKVFQIRLQLADDTEKLRLQQQRQEKQILDSVDDVGLRDQLVLDSREQLEEAIDAIEQAREEKTRTATEKFLQDLQEKNEAALRLLEEQQEAERTLREENELRALEGRTEAVDLADLSELQRVERFEASKLAIINKFNAIAQRGRQITADFEETVERNKTQAIVGLAVDLTSQVAGQSKTLFEINKAAGIANAIVNTAQGVTEALKLPYPLNLVAAASTLAVGVGQIATIRSATYGVGSSGGSSAGLSGGGGGVNIPDALTVTGDTQTEANTTAAPAIQINNPTIFTMDSTEMQEAVGPAALSFIREETTEGDATAIQTGSRQALDLTG